ncbi:MAG: helix-turn-helix domain-containing protein [Xanthobacteraceae bacterium]
MMSSISSTPANATPVTTALSSPERVKVQAFEYANGQVVAPHRHRRGQLVYAVTGVMEVATAERLWRVPPQRAVWVPPHEQHSMRAFGPVELRTVYVPPDIAPDGYPLARVIAVSPLLRELILRGIELPADVQDELYGERILMLVMDELLRLLKDAASAPDRSVPLPSGKDRRLARVCEAVLSDPANANGLEEWADIVGASKRTLARLFNRQFGISFLNWRQQVRVAEALTRLDQGHPVTRVAGDLGYETPAAFTAMFRRVTGLTPSAYAEGGRIQAEPGNDGEP